MIPFTADEYRHLAIRLDPSVETHKFFPSKLGDSCQRCGKTNSKHLESNVDEVELQKKLHAAMLMSQSREALNELHRD